MRRPRLVDLCCKAGGATKGYQDAGFYVVGVDIEPQPNYCGDEFHQADALTFDLDGFDAIHASPPCQAFTSLRHRTGGTYSDIVADTRRRLDATGVPWVIENVPGAPLRNPVVLCGSMFGLGTSDRILRRHRLFESSVLLLAPGPCRCHGRPVGGVYGTGGGGQQTRGWKFHQPDARTAMGIDWMTRAELSQAIPPAYTRHIGEQLAAHLEQEAA